MERKLVKQGREALTVTLPVKWLRERGLQAGNTVSVEERNQELVIGSGQIRAKKEVTIDIRNDEKSMAFHKIQGRYIEGYDIFTVLHSNQKWVQEIVPALPGVMIEEHTHTKTIMKSLIAVPEENFLAILRRAGHILLQQTNLLMAIADKKAKWEELKEQEKLLDYNLVYCLRYLNKYEKNEQSYKYFLLCATLESAGDQLSRIGEHLGNEKELAKKVSEGVKEYLAFLFGKDLKKMYTSLRAFRNSLSTETFAQGLAFALAETLYNYIGYLVENKDKGPEG